MLYFPYLHSANLRLYKIGIIMTEGIEVNSNLVFLFAVVSYDLSLKKAW